MIKRHRNNIMKDVICPLCGEKHKKDDWVYMPYNVVCVNESSKEIRPKTDVSWFTAGNSCGYCEQFHVNEMKMYGKNGRKIE